MTDAMARTAADLFLGTLKAHGVEFFICNPGTDFPPIVEAFSRAAESNLPAPKPIMVPHENLAVSMAHGAFLATGNIQAVMVHTNVGTANALNALLDVAGDQSAVLLCAGRSPITEKGLFGSRNRNIHWAQEMRDQAGMVREAVKFDYELRIPEQIGDVTARAIEIAMTEPRGGAYLSLPREPLAGPVGDRPVVQPRARPAVPHPAPDALETLAKWIAASERPMIVANSLGRTAEEFAIFSRVTEKFALPVVTFNQRFLCLPSTHPMHQGYEPGPLLAEADLVIILECDVPWIPSIQGPKAGAKIIQIGVDPAFPSYTTRGFPADLSIAAGTVPVLMALEKALPSKIDEGKVAARRQHLTEASNARRAGLLKATETLPAQISPEYFSRCFGEALKDDDVLFNEYPLRIDHCRRVSAGTYFHTSPAGGLGWSFGAALGYKLAAPDRFVAAAMGDGAYIFANPTACHWAAAGHDLPILTVILNNHRYAAVRNATLHMFKDGASGRRNGDILADLDPAPDYEKIVLAHGGYGARLEHPADVREGIAKAIDVVRNEKRQALLNVVCPY